MWLITPIGFFSVVEKPGDKQAGTLTVRSRVRGDLVALKENYLPTLGPIQESSNTDYRFRAVAPRADVSAAMARLVDTLDYSNFKSEVAKKQGQPRASLYHQVWDVLYHLQSDAAFAEKEPVADSYGGVVVSGGRKVLLREPTKQHGGYAWTFAKTEAKPDESPRDAAVRAVREKTGYDADIRISLRGAFKGSSSSTCYYVMDARHPPAKPNWQTTALRWVNFDEARDLIRQSPNAEGRDRDLAILDAAEIASGLIGDREHPSVQPEDWPDLKPMPDRHTVLYPKLWFNPEEMVRIRRGFYPTNMNEKWFLYFTGDRLRIHRSWTGILIFDVGFALDPKGGAYVTDVVVNRENREYSNTDDDEDLKLLEEIIRYYLLEPLTEDVVPELGKEIIVEVGSDGGSLTLYGIQSPGGWKFKVETSEAALVDDEDMPDAPERPWVATWRSALKQLDGYPWTQLYPLVVHPVFSDKVAKALQARQKKGLVIDWDQWNPVLMGSPEGDGNAG